MDKVKQCSYCKLNYFKHQMVLSEICMYCWTFNLEYKKLLIKKF